MNKIKWGIIGCGDVTERKSGPAFNKIEGSELVAVMRRSAEKARDYAQRHQVPKWYSNAAELIHDPDVNAVYIATPPDTHAKYTIEALEAGKPVYVEKPMARNFEECQAMIEASERTNIPLFVAYYRRALPGFLKVKELIDTGAIGAVRMVNLRLYKNMPINEGEELPWRVQPEISGGGHFVDLAAHQLDFLDFVLGPIENVKAMAENQGGFYAAEDCISASFRFKNGVLGNGSWCFSVSSEAEDDVLEFIGEKGKIVYSCFNVIPVTLVNSSGKKIFEYKNPDNIQLNLIKLVVSELLGKETSPSTGHTAARTSWVMDAVLKTYYSGKSDRKDESSN